MNKASKESSKPTNEANVDVHTARHKKGKGKKIEIKPSITNKASKESRKTSNATGADDYNTKYNKTKVREMK